MDRIGIAMSALCLAALAAPVQAGTLLCAVVDAHQCQPGAACTEVDLAEANFPRFIEVDLAGQRIRGTRPDGSEASSEIRASFRQQERLMLHGVEGGRSWSLLLADDGRFVLAAADVEAGYSLFGECIAR